MGFVNRQGGEERRNELAGAGELVDFDPDDPRIVKVHYDLSAWNFDQRADISQALAEAELPHAWDGDELVVPEAVEAAVDELFDRLEGELGPFAVVLDADAPSTEFGLDEWTESDRTLLTESLIAAEIPHRWEGSTVLVAADAEDSVDELLDAIEEGDMLAADDDASNEPPDGVLGTIFIAAGSLAKDPFDAKARTTLIDLAPHLNPKHPPYAFAPRPWVQAVAGVDAIVEEIVREAEGPAGDAGGDDASAVVEPATALRDLLRPFV